MIGRRLLVAEDSPRVHQAYANALLFVACLVYPQWPHLAARAEAEWSLLQAQPQITGKGPAFRLLAAAVGWRAARRVQQISGFRNYLRWQSRAVMAAPLTG